MVVRPIFFSLQHILHTHTYTHTENTITFNVNVRYFLDDVFEKYVTRGMQNV